MFLFHVRQFINRFPKVVVNDISFIDFKVDHQVEALSWLHCLGMPHWHYQFKYWVGILISQSHISQVCKTSLSYLVSDRQRSGPIDRTPGTPGSDKNVSCPAPPRPEAKKCCPVHPCWISTVLHILKGKVVVCLAESKAENESQGFIQSWWEFHQRTLHKSRRWGATFLSFVFVFEFDFVFVYLYLSFSMSLQTQK